MTELNDQQLKSVTGGTNNPEMGDTCVNQCLRSKGIDPNNASFDQIQACEKQCPGNNQSMETPHF